jgi:hypothetical protein
MKAALVEKGKASCTNDTLPAAAENNEAGAINSKHRRTKDPHTPEGSIHTCSSEDHPRDDVPSGFAPVGAADIIEEGEDLGISAEDQLKLCALCIKTITFRSKRRYSQPKGREPTCMPE